MSGARGGSRPSSESERQEVVDILCKAFAEDRLGVEEFERRVDLAHRAHTTAELDVLLRDLPKLRSDLPAPSPESRSPSLPESQWRLAEPDQVAEQNVVMGVLGGGVRKGSWRPARYNYAVGFWGGVEMDFRESVLPAFTEVRCFAMMGGVEIIVPPDVVVDTSGIGILGGFEHRAEAQDAPPGAPVIRITGLAFMGGVEVTVRHPGETPGDAKRRRRLERKERRRLRRGR
jgi:hypothetical protein